MTSILSTHRRPLLVAGLLILIVVAFVLGAARYRAQAHAEQQARVHQQDDRMVRPHSPVIGPRDAPVTLVEFFDPACESCRYFYPKVKEILARHPKEVRLVLRYAPFHAGSDQVVALLFAAQAQGRLQPVLEALLAAQPQWADHAQPDLSVAVQVAQQAGLDMAQAAEQARSATTLQALRQDVADLEALGIRRTPTFFVNGQGLERFGPEALEALVAQEVARTRR
ncbi:DsbA family protein [Sphaerotilus natans]|jgi:protein-disulfide isomerase|uniref:Thioredoxin-like fold domain-containing protein n=1 Tax=Sphaerotilus natans subsp. natans DSM 6575 TaxID=1286631 RepID=A0A059KH30_9BURK|nr:thioredoxin domain-containing protein [Sphaerotilus natans]KDB50670.1 hypothetical protein X805_37430 [Sphaerotilus natans subsp. natans DSM 6575]SIR41405.1 Protein-disulfide isomerase [Sphaerotilus natans]